MRKTILQKILKLQERLKPLTPAQSKWAHSHYTSIAYANSRRVVWCQCCGHIHQSTKEILELDYLEGHYCPNCGEYLELAKQNTGRTVKEVYYNVFGVALGQWQVFRVFLAQRINTKDKETTYSLDEIFQCWLDERGSEYIISRSYRRSLFYGVKWDFTSQLIIPREHNYVCNGQYVMEDMFDLRNCYIYQRSSITKLLKRNGWHQRFLSGNWSPVECAKRILIIPELEMLAKTQLPMFLHLVDIGNYAIPFLHAIRICNRNHYTITDPSTWIDYLQFLSTLHLDTHNAHYVCPKDLHHSHDVMLKRVRRKKEKEKLEKHLAEIVEAESKYQKEKSRFFNLSFREAGIIIVPLKSVREFYDEGNSMKHCVFENKYYTKKDSLILSATDENSNRLETIEVNLKTFSVIQSRGVCNQNTPRHNEIINLVNKNMNLIRQAI